MADVVHAAGWPADALVVLSADPEAFLDAALGHEAVEVVTFTGGVEVGKRIARRLGYRRGVLELGGNDPLVVLGDADLDEAAALAVRGAFQNSGQRCTAVKRILAVEAIADELVERIVQRTGELVVGDPSDQRTDMGTVITEQAAADFCVRVGEAAGAGARVRCGGAVRGNARRRPDGTDRRRPCPPGRPAHRAGDVRPRGAHREGAGPR
ncbi:MAG: aldehyde dehydrogenase family protein [Solirubrobacteraceae bacterium MAG38_C4-C5]|nr:aldehyde dehydrogenase family protein [Candidatus Siliceabacter maunaloa]